MRVPPYNISVGWNSCFYQISGKNRMRNDATMLRKLPFNLTTRFFVPEKHILRFLRKNVEPFEKRKEQTIFSLCFLRKKVGKVLFSDNFGHQHVPIIRVFPYCVSLRNKEIFKRNKAVS